MRRFVIVVVAVLMASAPAFAFAQKVTAQRKALVDAQGVLRSHGFVVFSPASGDTVLNVPEDFSLEPGHWKWTGTPEVAWAAVTPPEPTHVKIRRFEPMLRDAFADKKRYNAFLTKYPRLLWALRDGDLAEVQDLLVDARTAADLTPAEYAAIKAAAATAKLGLTLP